MSATPDERRRQQGHGPGPRWAVPLLVLGTCLVLAGLGFHSASGWYRASGPDDTWRDFLDHGAVRVAAWAAVAGGVSVVVTGWNARRR